MLSASSSSTTSTVFTAPFFSATPAPKPLSRVRFQPARAFSTGACASEETAAASFLVSPPHQTSLYDVLGIPSAATYHEIKTAYRRLARVCHPDVAAMGQEGSSADEFMRIHEAYSTLSDPAKRAEYDQKIFRRIRPLSADYSGYFTGRNWETDQCW
ncbi:chaperone protein dnaJ 11, chloroplastic [Argentina anserina]|uniref:chaperone protein dnaJ 11, chloroplastic n=1 Tax=Argentina anserina TaxID=57926 RepID=UPI0021767139|nr:chaperone protein dnaJ 11, chloroplastic [Potentilla anserina]